MATVQVCGKSVYFPGFKTYGGLSVLLIKLCLITICLSVSHGKNYTDYCQKVAIKCICTDDNVECHNAKINSSIPLYPYIKDNVKEVIITGSNFIEMPQNFLGSCHNDPSLQLNDLRLLDLSSNNIRSVHGKTFHCMPKLETLILRENQWRIDDKKDQNGYFTSLPVLKHLDLTNSFDEVWNGSVHVMKLADIFHNTDMSKLETLLLAKNEFFTFSESAANSLCELTSLKALNLSHNNLGAPSLPTKTNCMENLTILDLSHNTMKRIPAEFLQKVDSLKKLKDLHLGDNLFNCDCGLIDTWEWLQTTSVPVDKAHLKCTDGYHSSYIGKTIMSLKKEDLKCLEMTAPNSKAVSVVTGIIFTVIALTVVGFLVVQRERVGLVCKKMKKKMPNFRTHSGYNSVQEIAFVNNENV